MYNNLKKELDLGSETKAAQASAPYGDSQYDAVLDLTMRIDAALKTTRPDGWRGVLAKERVVKQSIYNVLMNVAQVERIFLIIKQQSEY